MRGPYHELLFGLIRQAIATKAYTQDSFATSIPMHQTTFGRILGGKGVKSLDLDEADAALRHMQLDLQVFVANPERAVPAPTPTPLPAALALKIPGIQGLLEALLLLGKADRQRVVASAAALAQVTAGERARAKTPATRKKGGSRRG